MFDVEAGIRDWKRELLASEAVRAEDADELEDHLRQMIEELSVPQPTRKALLSLEEAVLIAKRRLGGSQALAHEFAKADPGAVWRRRWIWMLSGFVGIEFVSFVIRYSAVIFRGRWFNPNSLGGGILYSAVVFLAIAGIIALAYRASRAPASQGVSRFASRVLSSRSGIVGLALLAFAPGALLVPLGITEIITQPDGTVTRSHSHNLAFAQVGLSVAPIAALALLLWKDRLRRMRVAESSASKVG
jgi:hypothetical protein